jgi:hypothetical protein
MAIETPKPDKPKTSTSAPVRMVGWGGAATLALAVLALTLQSEAGSERLQSAFATTVAPQAVAEAEPVEPAPEKDAEIKRLETLVVALANDRERQSARIASLERNLEDMTGSIKQQVAIAAKAITPPPAPPPVPAAPVITPLAMAPVSPPATSAAGWSGNNAPQNAPQAAPPVAEAVPMPPERAVAALPVAEAPEAPRKPEIGIDLGGAANLDVLNARWAAVKANFGPMLAGLYPRATQNHRPNSSEYRLIAGPLPSNAVAVQLCAKFVAARVTCRAVKFDGERMVQR